MTDSMGPALEMAAYIHVQTARQTGRTSAMLDAAKPGTRIITPTTEIARYIERQVRDRQLEDVKAHCIGPSMHRLCGQMHHYKPGAMVFDHTWFEQFYLTGLKQMRGQLGDFMKAIYDEDRKASDIIRPVYDMRFEGPWL